MTFVYNLMKDCLIYSVLSNDPVEIEGNYPALKQFAFHNSFFLSKASQETRIETVFFLFAVLHEQIINRLDLM